MNRIPVKSSFIATIGYDQAAKTLEVELKNGNVYQYLEFPPEEFSALRAAKSLGAHFNIVKRGFPSRRALELEEPKETTDGVLPNLQKES